MRMEETVNYTTITLFPYLPPSKKLALNSIEDTRQSSVVWMCIFCEGFLGRWDSGTE